jgi:hypothetical protein
MSRGAMRWFIMYLWWKSYGILNNSFIENSFTSKKIKIKYGHALGMLERVSMNRI